MAHLKTALAEPESTSSPPDWVPVTHYARHYHLGESTVRKWVRLGWISHIRLGKTIRVNLNELPGGAA